ncbi:MAG: TM1266 family iron-only hydrogenase system putative regulator [Candidatus Limiplasma sp.]|nr:TM1266 family iron-only hydrogenase system putative regulator [Candidatus Limiplasma sp.]
MEPERLGFIGIVLEREKHASLVNAVISQHASLVRARMGVPDAASGASVIGLIVQGDNRAIGSLTAKLGNIKGVQVKSALVQGKAPEAAPPDPSQHD